MSETPDWLTVGAAVASVTHSRHSDDSIRYTTIDRIGKRDVVLKNDERFNVHTLRRRDGDTWASRESMLMRRDDPHVLETSAKIRRSNALNAAKKACEEFRYTGSVRGSEVTASDVILALAPLTGVADEIAALFTTPADQGDNAAGGGS